MGKNPKSVSKVKNWSVYPLLLSKKDKEDYRGVVIRATNRTKSIDIEVYDQKGQRVKAKSEDFVNGKIAGGYDQNIIDIYNLIIDKIKVQISEYISSHQHFNKDLLLRYIYPVEFLNNHKRKRTKYITIPVQHKGQVYDSIQIEQKELNELDAPYISKRTFINSDGQPKTIEGVFDSETGESLIESEDDYNELVIHAKLTKDAHEHKEKERQRILAMRPDQRYKEGHYNKQDIFECFAACWYPNPATGKEITNAPYQSIVLRLLQYQVNENPSHDIKDFNEKWCKDFLNYLFNAGWVNVNGKSITNPFDFDYSIFKREPVPYLTSTKEKHFKGFRGVVKELGKLGILPRVDLSELSIKDFVTNKELADNDSTPRDEQHLTKRELDYLFHFDFKEDELNRVRDIFILQIGFGGLRVNEFNPDNLSIKDSGHGFKMASFRTSHNHKFRIVHNPLNDYTEGILNKYDGHIPFYEKEGIQTGIDENHYNAMLKKIAAKAGLTRLVKGKLRNEKQESITDQYPIASLISSLWARKTLSETLHQIGLIEEQIKWFTGHTGKKEVIDHYLKKKFQDVVLKKKLLEQFKFSPEKITKL